MRLQKLAEVNETTEAQKREVDELIFKAKNGIRKAAKLMNEIGYNKNLSADIDNIASDLSNVIEKFED